MQPKVVISYSKVPNIAVAIFVSSLKPHFVELLPSKVEGIPKSGAKKVSARRGSVHVSGKTSNENELFTNFFII